jgi:hypothetical protein
VAEAREGNQSPQYSADLKNEVTLPLLHVFIAQCLTNLAQGQLFFNLSEVELKIKEKSNAVQVIFNN